MELSLSPEYARFRDEVSAFLAEAWTGAAARDPAEFRAKAIARGYLYRGVPKAYGGSEQPPDPLKAYVIRQEFNRVRAPGELPGNSTNIFLPTLLAAGADWQKAMFAPRTLTGEYVWCQGYSEPGAGSDLASVRTSAALEGNEWVIHGQKVWTSNAHRATHMYVLARTEPDAPKHQGISYLLIRTDQPGLTIRPLKQITGGAEFNEVFFDGVRTPRDWFIGERGQGWAVSRATLSFERNSVGGADVSQRLFEQLLRLARTTDLNGRPAIRDPLVRDELVRLQAMVTAHRMKSLEDLRSVSRGRPLSPMTGSFNKIYNSTIAERIAKVAQTVIDAHAMAQPEPNAAGPGRWITQFMNSIAAQIGGGTSNIHRNIIAERGLGLPRDDAG